MKIYTTNPIQYTAYRLPLTAYRFSIIAFCFLLSAPCFAQIMQPPEDAPRFVYQTSLSMGYGIGTLYVEEETHKNENLSFEIQQLLTYRFNKYFYTGIGTGLDFWFYDNQTSTFIPIFANASAKLMHKKTTPFVYVNFGYAFKWQTEMRLEDLFFYGTKAGIYLQSGIGINLKFSDKLSLLLSVYYKMQNSAVKVRESELILREIDKINFHFVGLRVSLLY